MKIKVSVYVDEAIWKKAKNRGYNVSQLLNDTLRISLGMEEYTKTQIKKEIDETENYLNTLKTQLQQIKIKEGTSLEEYLQVIDENEKLKPEKKEEIKDEINRAVDTVRDNVNTASARALLLRNRYGIDITAKMLISFANLNDISRHACTCELSYNYRLEYQGKICGRCGGVIEKHRRIKESEKKEDEILEKLKKEAQNRGGSNNAATETEE